LLIGFEGHMDVMVSRKEVFKMGKVLDDGWGKLFLISDIELDRVERSSLKIHS